MRLFLLSSRAVALLCPAVDLFTVSEGKLCKDSMQACTTGTMQGPLKSWSYTQGWSGISNVVGLNESLSFE